MFSIYTVLQKFRGGKNKKKLKPRRHFVFVLTETNVIQHKMGSVFLNDRNFIGRTKKRKKWTMDGQLWSFRILKKWTKKNKTNKINRLTELEKKIDFLLNERIFLEILDKNYRFLLNERILKKLFKNERNGSVSNKMKNKKG